MAMRGGEKFTWVIKNPSSLQSDSIKSDRFVLDDDDASEDSSSVSDDGEMDNSPLNQLDALEDTSHTVENHGISYNNVEAETEVPNGDTPTENVDGDDAWSFVSNVGTASETANNLVIEIQPVDETVDVNGFDLSSSQVESVSHIFNSHPELVLGFRRKNQRIRRAYMNELLSLIETLCQSTEKLSEDDLSNAEETLGDLIDVGFKLDWLKIKLNEVSEKKKKEQCSVARMQTMEEQLQKLKQTFLDLETQLQKEKAEAVAARAPLSFNDVVC